MPCDQIVENRVEIGSLNATLLGRALEALGARGITIRGGQSWFVLDGVRCQIQGGKLIIPEGSEHLADKLKRAYSVETVKYTAQRNGWTLKRKSEFVFEVVK